MHQTLFWQDGKVPALINGMIHHVVPMSQSAVYCRKKQMRESNCRFVHLISSTRCLCLLFNHESKKMTQLRRSILKRQMWHLPWHRMESHRQCGSKTSLYNTWIELRMSDVSQEAFCRCICFPH